MKTKLQKIGFETPITIFLVFLGVLYSFHTLNADDIYFIHKAWMVANNLESAYEGYPFPLFVSLASVMITHVDMQAFVWVKIIAALVTLYMLNEIYGKRDTNYYFLGAGIFYTLLANRFLDIRPELLASLTFIFLIYLIGKHSHIFLAKSKTPTIIWLYILALLPFITPRYSIAGVALLCTFFYLNKNTFTSKAIASIIALILAIGTTYIVAGTPPDGTIFQQSNNLGVMPTKTKLRQIFGNNLLPLYLISFSAIFVYLKKPHLWRSSIFLLLLFVTSYTAFELNFDHAPYRYVSQPTILIVATFLFFQLTNRAPEPNQANQLGQEKWFRWLGIFLIALFAYNAIKDSYKLGNISSTWLKEEEILTCSNTNPQQIIRPEKTNPIKHLCLAEKICLEHQGHSVYADYFRWNPICLNDSLSAKVWSGRIDRLDAIKEVEEKNLTEKYLLESGRGIYIYR